MSRGFLTLICAPFIQAVIYSQSMAEKGWKYIVTEIKGRKAMFFTLDCKKRIFYLKIFAVCSSFFLLTLWSGFQVYAADAEAQPDTSEKENSSYDYSEYMEEFQSGSGLMEALPDDAQGILKSLDIYGPDYNSILNIDFSRAEGEIMKLISGEAKTPFGAFASVCGIMILFSILDGFREGLKSSPMGEVMGTVSVLVVTSLLVMPVTRLIESCAGSLMVSAGFLMAYLPVFAGIVISSGNSVSGASYYAIMIAAGNVIAFLASRVVVPFMSIFLGIGVMGGISPQLKLGGISSAISKAVKWILGFSMSVFSALLTFNTLLTASADSVATRAVRFTVSSFVPVVGSALSEAYRTVKSGMGLLKSGVGVFVIISIAVIFLPVLIQCILWMASLGLCKVIGEILGQNTVVTVLSGVSAVLGIMIALILSVSTVFVISTTIILVVGGGG